MEKKIVMKSILGENGKTSLVPYDYSPVRVRYKNGYETVLVKCIAEVHERRGHLEILGSGEVAPPPPKKKKEKPDRDALVKKAIELDIASKEELVTLSDSEIEALVKEAQ